jgi:glycosyltransferase involved in cell wall biosynthesis
MDRVFEKTILHNKLMPNLYQQTDIGLFPNRAEGGTNLVMMEYMACERPVIASFATGHKDILKDSGPILLQKGEFDGIGWFDADIDDILNKLEEVYLDRSRLSILGKNCLKCVADFSWDRTAQEIVKIAFQS